MRCLERGGLEKSSCAQIARRAQKNNTDDWILQAKKPETRAKRVTETASLAAKNIRANQWRQ
ncbi:MAG: YdeI/OmpD-associated family protein [Verrucomicrobiota bacterium]